MPLEPLAGTEPPKGRGGGPDSGELRPLADRLRPRSLDEVVGQEHLLAPDGPIGSMLSAGALHSMVLWGPPGVGKTTIARLIAEGSGREFIQVSAVHAGVAELKKIFGAARERLGEGLGTVLFVDEIHRFNRAQQDGFLPYVEDGSVALIGATTENPSFELNSALLSRAQVMILRRLGHESLELLMRRAEDAFGAPLNLTADAREMMIGIADGDGRALFNLVERAAAAKGEVDGKALLRMLTRRSALYDKSQDWHYNLISALHKSVRGSDPDAALYWLARMFAGGEDPRYIARRVTRMAVEDVGLSDPDALAVCLNAWEAYERIGSPEGELAIAQAVVYLALSPKSNAVYKAAKSADAEARRTGSLPPPKHILNAPTKLMKDIGHSEGYQYDHDFESGVSGQDYFPEGARRAEFYRPVERGFERTMKKRLDYFNDIRRRARLKGGGQ